MTNILTCDHCEDRARGVPGPIVDRRSRATMVRQLKAANSLATELKRLLVYRTMTIRPAVAPDGDLEFSLNASPHALADLILALETYERVRPAVEDLELTDSLAEGDDRGDS